MQNENQQDTKKNAQINIVEEHKLAYRIYLFIQYQILVSSGPRLIW